MSLSIRNQFQGFLNGEFSRGHLMPNLTAGLLVGVSEIVFAISLGGLVFSGAFEEYLPLGIGIALVSMAILLISTSLTSSIPGVMGSLQDNPAVVLSLMVPALITSSSEAGNLTTVLVTIALVSISTGIFLMAIGQFKLGGLVRFIPYPVVGGFMAGLGWLLTQASFEVMTGKLLTLDNLQALSQPSTVMKWLPGVIFALVMLAAMKKSTHTFIMPALLALAITSYFLFLLVSGISIQNAIDQGLFLGELRLENPWTVLSLENLGSINWRGILGQSGNFMVIMILSAISLLFNISGLELVTEHDIDLNRELRAAGVANILSGLVGGMAGYHALSYSTLSHRIGARGRLAGITAGSICALVFLTGSNLMAYFPISIMGGLLLYLGLDFLYDWLVGAWSQLSKSDYAIVILILLVIAATDILIGIGVGIVAMVILFVVKYSQINVVQHDLTGAELRSNVNRSILQKHALSHLGKKIHILELRGYIFFGTANILLDRVRNLLQGSESQRVDHIVLDFQRVSGLDSSAANSFVRIRQIAEAHSARLVLTSVRESIRDQLKLGGFWEDEQCVCFHPDLDHGLQWCEDRVIEGAGISSILRQPTFQEWLIQGGFKENQATRFIEYLERLEFKAGEYLIRQGDESKDMFFIEKGQVSIYLENEGGQPTRLSTMDTGTMVGEIGMFREQMRTASVIADRHCLAYRLSKSCLERMKERDPDLAANFHELSVRFLADRLTDTNLLVGALRR